MKKVGIVTFYHNSSNYGGNFQAYALCKFLNKNNIPAEQIAFTYKRAKNSEPMVHKLKRKGFSGVVKQFSNKIDTALHRKKIAEIRRTRSQVFSNFQNTLIPHCDTVYSYKNISECKNDYDIFITGSDQVFNGYDDIFFLGFPDKNKRLIAYAASNAKGLWTEEEQKKIKPLINRFSAISVRDSLTLESVNCVADVSAVQTLDPTLLLDKTDWDEIKKNINICNKYLLCYFLGDNPHSRTAAAAYAKKHDLEIINIPMNRSGVSPADKNFGRALYDISPEQFISLIENAECIFTDSFHCIIFSHIYQKQYYVFNRNKKGEMNSRITDITALFGTEKHFIKNSKIVNPDYLDSLGRIDYTSENTKLNDMRKFSEKFLLDNTAGVDDGEILQKISGCTGCHACYSVCPKDSISMVPDNEGFLRPVIDPSLCIGCRRCEKVCPILNKYEKTDIGSAFACINRNRDTRLQSSSGGIFTLLAEYVIKKGGIVFGAAFNSVLEVVHTAVDNVENIAKLRGSKYIQSTIGDTYKECKMYLESGRTVLFTGTPCQIGGLLSYLGRDYKNLITQDIICHGVPSADLWHEYLNSLKIKPADSADINFRNKNHGWKNYGLSIPLENGTELLQGAKDNPFLKAFQNNLSLRKSCYGCHFKHKARQSDITLADFWGIRFVAEDMNDDKGTSLVITNSQKGKDIFDEIKSETVWRKVDFETAIAFNQSMFTSSPRPENREAFFEAVKTSNFENATKKYLPGKAKTFCIKVIRRIKRIV